MGPKSEVDTVTFLPATKKKIQCCTILMFFKWTFKIGWIIGNRFPMSFTTFNSIPLHFIRGFLFLLKIVINKFCGWYLKKETYVKSDDTFF
jgi:hypothetical protein